MPLSPPPRSPVSPTATTIHRDGRTCLCTCIADTLLLGPAALTISLPSQVTGGSGYLSADIVSPLLKAGYHVRTYVISHIAPLFHPLAHHLCSTDHGIKVAQLKDRLAALDYSDKAEVIDIPDITHGNLPLDGVSTVIHTASPVGGDSAANVDVRCHSIITSTYLRSIP